MAEAYIFDADASNFNDVVVGNSHKLPVLVDFWAEWCQPCQSLIPILHKLAEDMAGQFILAKVNSDEQQELAQRYGVRSLPTVKLFVNGEIVDEFMGVQPESQIVAMLDKYLVRESDNIMAAALQEYQQGNVEVAIQKMAEAAAMDPANLRVQLMYARVLAEHDRGEEARQIINKLPADQQADPEVASLKAQLEFAAQAGAAGDANDLLARIEQDPDDHAAREQLSVVYVSTHDYAKALEQCLEIMKRDRSYHDDAGRKGMLRIFELLGNEGPIVTEYRRKMSSLLF
ncbi:MAG: thioredoxin [Granulosicoccaceae bacterium]|jgi:putative thioredoxin